MRERELLGLRWSDIDLSTGTVHIARAAQALPATGVTFRTRKTAGSRRTVPDTVRTLREHRAKQAERHLALGPGCEDGDLMLTAGVHPKVVSQRLGHSSVNITLDTYSHVLPSMQRDAAAALDRLLALP